MITESHAHNMCVTSDWRRAIEALEAHAPQTVLRLAPGFEPQASGSPARKSSMLPLGHPVPQFDVS